MEPKNEPAKSSSLVNKENRGIFEGMSFKYPPVSKEDYINAYEEYVRRCSN
mgnify:CR=1 FL=1